MHSWGFSRKISLNCQILVDISRQQLFLVCLSLATAVVCDFLRAAYHKVFYLLPAIKVVIEMKDVPKIHQEIHRALTLLNSSPQTDSDRCADLVSWDFL